MGLFLSSHDMVVSISLGLGERLGLGLGFMGGVKVWRNIHFAFLKMWERFANAGRTP